MVKSTEESPFVFVGEVLALDLVNTIVVVRGKQYDLLQTPNDVKLWWEAASHYHPEMDRVRGDLPEYDGALLNDVKAFRDSIRRLFSKVIAGQPADDEDVQTLNNVLRMGHPALEGQNATSFRQVYLSYDVPAAAMLLPVALSTLQLLTQTDLMRLHKCHNNRCILLFYDTTKSGTRQWCSAACLDRERSHHRYELSKQIAHED